MMTVRKRMLRLLVAGVWLGASAVAVQVQASTHEDKRGCLKMVGEARAKAIKDSGPRSRGDAQERNERKREASKLFSVAVRLCEVGNFDDARGLADHLKWLLSTEAGH